VSFITFIFIRYATHRQEIAIKNTHLNVNLVNIFFFVTYSPQILSTVNNSTCLHGPVLGC
jgi:hypothetical protein